MNDQHDKQHKVNHESEKTTFLTQQEIDQITDPKILQIVKSIDKSKMECQTQTFKMPKVEIQIKTYKNLDENTQDYKNKQEIIDKFQSNNNAQKNDLQIDNFNNQNNKNSNTAKINSITKQNLNEQIESFSKIISNQNTQSRFNTDSSNQQTINQNIRNQPLDPNLVQMIQRFNSYQDMTEILQNIEILQKIIQEIATNHQTYDQNDPLTRQLILGLQGHLQDTLSNVQRLEQFQLIQQVNQNHESGQQNIYERQAHLNNIINQVYQDQNLNNNNTNLNNDIPNIDNNQNSNSNNIPQFSNQNDDELLTRIQETIQEQTKLFFDQISNSQNSDIILASMSLIILVTKSLDIYYSEIIENQDTIQWMAYDDESIFFMIVIFLIMSKNLAFFHLSFLWIALKTFYQNINGNISKDDIQHLIQHFLDNNPLVLLTLIIFCMPNMIDNKLDLSIWTIQYFFYSLSKAYIQLIEDKINKIIEQHINIPNSFQELPNFRKFLLVLMLLFTLNLVVGFYIFQKCDFFRIYMLLYGLFLNIVEVQKLLKQINKLLKNQNFYLDNNHDQLNDPFFNQIIFYDICYQSLLMNFLFNLVYNQSDQDQDSYQYSLWYLFIFLSIVTCAKKIFENIESFIRTKAINYQLEKQNSIAHQENIDTAGDCSICHEKLIIARSLQCKHMFHKKCIYQWLQSQNAPSCPMCRSPIVIYEQQQFGVFGNIYNVVCHYISQFGTYLNS